MADNFSALYQLYKACVARITVRLSSGDLATGTGFHIGNGYLVTARHVIENAEIEDIVPHHFANEPVNVSRAILHESADVDIAILETNFSLEHYMTKTTIMNGDKPREKTDFIPIGGHLDDWIGDELVLSKAMLIGYPSIPRSNKLVPVAIETEVNAVVDRYDAPHPHFVVSAIPRGGFSGGPAFSEYGFLLGVTTEALFEGDQPSELGFAAVVSVEPLLVLIDEQGIDCGENSRFAKKLFQGEWDDLV